MVGKNNCHFSGYADNKKMMIDFINSSLRIAGFLGMDKPSPEETEARDECTGTEDQSETTSVHGAKEDTLDRDPLQLAQKFGTLTIEPEAPPVPVADAAPKSPFASGDGRGAQAATSGDGCEMQVDASGDGSEKPKDTDGKPASSSDLPAFPKSTVVLTPAPSQQIVRFKAAPPKLRATLQALSLIHI